MNQERKSTMGSLAKDRSIGAVRCLQCFERITFPSGGKTAKCPKCGYEWRLSWPMGPDFPRIRGPVWETNRRLADEAEKQGGSK